MDKVLFSSENEVWATPQDFFDKLNQEFHFNLDPCALPENAKCSKFFTPADNGLIQDWGGQKCSVTLLMVERLLTGCVSAMRKAKSQIQQWLCLFQPEAKKPGTVVVALIPARTDTRFFHDYIYHKAKEIRFIRGRLKFGGSKNAAPFPSMVVIF